MSAPFDSASLGLILASVENVFRTMLGQPVSIGEPRFGTLFTSSDAQRAAPYIRARIRLTGDAAGEITVVMPATTAIAAVRTFVGRPLACGSADFDDAVGELANMIAGGAVSRMSPRAVGITCPEVMMGAPPASACPAGSACVSIPFTTAAGPFVIEAIMSAHDGISRAA